MPVHISPDQIPHASLDSLVKLAESTPLGVRGVAALTGVVLTVAGARLYRFAVLVPGLLVGVLLGAMLPTSIDNGIRIGAMVVLAIVGAMVCFMVERVAVHAIGAIVVAGLVNAAWPMFSAGATAPWWGLAGGAVVGLFLFPSVFHLLLVLVTSLLGAITLAYAAGYSDNLLVVGGVTLVGLVLQTGLRGTGKRKD